MSQDTGRKQAQKRKAAETFAGMVADHLVAENPGLFVTSELCDERSKGIAGRLEWIFRLVLGLLVVTVGVLATTLARMIAGTGG